MSFNNRSVPQRSLAHYMIMLIMLVIGYEWFVSGIDKLSSGVFISGLHKEMMDAIKSGSPYAFYTPFLKSFVIPNSAAIASMIEFGEIIIGAAFLVISIIGLIKGSLPRWLSITGLVAAIIALFLSLNIFLYVGAKFFFSTEDPFDEGISLDFIMILMSIVFIIYFSGMNKIRQSIARNHA